MSKFWERFFEDDDFKVKVLKRAERIFLAYVVASLVFAYISIFVVGK